MNIKNYIPVIQEKLLNLGFVNCKENPCLEVKITPSGPIPSESKQWFFSSFDGYENVVLDSKQLTYQTSDYDNFESYYAKYQKISDALVLSVPNFENSVLIQRLGLRYVTISQAGEVNIFGDRKGIIVFRITQGEKGLSLPPDLMLNSPMMKKKLEIDCIIGLVDIDHTYNPIGIEKYNREFIEDMFYGMHDNSHDLFMSIVSDEGKNKWN